MRQHAPLALLEAGGLERRGGSRLLTGALDPSAARALADPDGVTLAEAVSEFDVDPSALGFDPERVARIAAFVG